MQFTTPDVVVSDGDEVVPLWAALFVHEADGVQQFVEDCPLLGDAAGGLQVHLLTTPCEVHGLGDIVDFIL